MFKYDTESFFTSGIYNNSLFIIDHLRLMITVGYNFTLLFKKKGVIFVFSFKKKNYENDKL